MTWVQWAAIDNMTVDWGLVGQVLVVWLALSIIASPFLGTLLYKLRTRREFQALLESERRRVRLEKLVDLADQYDAAATDKERQRVFIKATALGFTVPDETEYHAFMDEGEGPRAA